MIKLNIRAIKKRYKLGIVASLAFLIWFAFILPNKLFDDPTSTILYGTDGELLGARIATDGQWRFPETEVVPTKFEKSILCFEDQYFYYHPGVNVVSVVRALIQNIEKAHIVSGGSTITMQTIRIMRKGKPRNIYQKLIEMVMAARLECSYTKKEILALYASYAPFGGNVVGIDAAAWRFFGRSASELSWAESAMLAVLPNAPSLIYPGKNNTALKNKRNRLLKRLFEKKIIDKTTYELATLENVPTRVHRLPRVAPHLLERANLEHKGVRVETTINSSLQKQVNNITKEHHGRLAANQIHNLAVMVMDVESGAVLSYVGNSQQHGKERHSNEVDVITSRRSTGSVLKPLLYAAMLNRGELLPKMLVPDVPTQVAGYSPKNYDLKYRGAVAANKALAQSLNIPAVRMLRNFGVDQLHDLLRRYGMTTLNRNADHYGLSLILGGAEATLWDLCGIYGSMARVLNHYNECDGSYYIGDIHSPYYMGKGYERGKEREGSLVSAAAIYQTFDALLDVSRPDVDSGWQHFESAHKIAWKTGTSFGFRDAWAIGATPRYVVGVWVGNADGEGRPGLTGVSVAAPLMFDVFNLLKVERWFDEPTDEIIPALICRASGHRAGRWCEEVDTLNILQQGMRTPVCSYHQLIHLDKSRRFRVTSKCEKIENMVHARWFVLPPVMEWYYKRINPLYRQLPPYMDGCSAENNNAMEMIYPQGNDRIFVPRDFDGELTKVVFEAAHQNEEAKIYWHIDDQYIGTTQHDHKMELCPSVGDHVLALTDNQGNTLKKRFTIVGK